MSHADAVHVLARCPVVASAATAPVSDRRRSVAWYAAFAAFAGAVAAMSGQPVQWTWGAWAAGGYALAALTAAVWRSRGREAALAIALAGALAAPLAWQVTFGRTMPKADESSLGVVARAADLLLHHGTPYLPADHISHALEYNPYEPAMTIFGLPAAAGLHGAAGNPRLWMAITAAAVFAAAFRLARPGSALRSTTFAFSSPVLALPLTTGLTDLPVLALLCLALACTAAYPRRRRGPMATAIAIGAACALKATAWPALPVVGAMLAARDGARVATRFVVTACITTTALVAATAPASVTAPAALFHNTVLFPLGMTRFQTEAVSPLPGHLLAATGPAGHWAAIGLLCAASLAMGAALLIWPPADTRAAAWRLAVSLAVLFTLAPASRFGYFAYPAALLGFARVPTHADGAGLASPFERRTRPTATPSSGLIAGLRGARSRGADRWPLRGYSSLGKLFDHVRGAVRWPSLWQQDESVKPLHSLPGTNTWPGLTLPSLEAQWSLLPQAGTGSLRESCSRQAPGCRSTQPDSPRHPLA
jgi:Glycosyltransferase family 87